VQSARQIFVEAVAAEMRKPLKVEISERLTPSEKTPAGEQFIIPGTR